MSRALRFSDVSELPENIRKRLQKRFDDAPRAAIAAPRRKRRDLEHNEQVVFFNRIRALALNERERYALAADRTYAIPNGGGRSKAEAGRLKAEGVRKGVPDIFVSLPRGKKCGLYIEMKSVDGRLSPEQEQWIEESCLLGYGAAVCYGADEAVRLWRAYVDSVDAT